MAYDTKKAFMFQVWKHKNNPVKFVGSVYNTRHGPQPLTIGIKIIALKKSSSFQSDGLTPQFYSVSQFKDEKYGEYTRIIWHLVDKNKSVEVKIEEYIRFHNNKLERFFNVKGLKKMVTLILPKQLKWQGKKDWQKPLDLSSSKLIFNKDGLYNIKAELK